MTVLRTADRAHGKTERSDEADLRDTCAWQPRPRRPWPRAIHDRAAPRREIKLPPTSKLNNIVVTLNAVLSQALQLYVEWIVFISRKWMVTTTRLIWRGKDELEERRLRSPKVGALWNQDEAAHELVTCGFVVGQVFQEAHSFITSAFLKFASGCPQPKYLSADDVLLCSILILPSFPFGWPVGYYHLVGGTGSHAYIPKKQINIEVQRRTFWKVRREK